VTPTANEAARPGNPYHKPLVVGLTGGIGSGKSTVAGLFSALGVPVLDSDSLARELVRPGEPALDAITAVFGAGCLQHDGTLDRAWMRRKIFSDPAGKQQLEAILHPAVRNRMEAWLGTVQAPYCVLVIPLLLEAGQLDLVDRVPVQEIMASQADRKTRLAAADDIIDNDANPDTLQQRVADLHRQFLEIMHEH
jgi:dephospho-CoA kinase